MTSARIDVEDVTPPDGVGKPNRFSVAANKSTGASHPLDRRRWIDVILTSHKSGRQLDECLLSRSLRERGGWSPDRASDLAGEYEFALELLDHATVSSGPGR